MLKELCSLFSCQVEIGTKIKDTEADYRGGHFLLCRTLCVMLMRASRSGDADNLCICFTASLVY